MELKKPDKYALRSIHKRQERTIQKIYFIVDKYAPKLFLPIWKQKNTKKTDINSLNLP